MHSQTLTRTNARLSRSMMLLPFILSAGLFLLFSGTELRAQTGFEKLPLTINTPDQNELFPVISADGKTLYFTRTRAGLDGGAVFDIWKSAVDGNSYSAPQFIGGTLGSHYGVAVASVAPDNNTLYLIGKLQEDSPPDGRVYVTHRTSTDWSIPEPLRIHDLNARGIFTDYNFGPNQQTLLMAVERDSSLGDRDLYVSFADKNGGGWSRPLWLGATVNSAYTEMTPYLASDNKTLYFSSNRPGGIGQIDVYRSTRLDDSWQKWSPVENLGPKVNRLGRTTYYTEDAEGTHAYITWKASATDQSDIYRVAVTHQNAVALLHGIVSDQSGKPILARVQYEKLSTGEQLGTARSNPTTGEYQISLPAGEVYAIHADRDGYFPTSEHVDLRSLTAYQSVDRNLTLTKIETGTTVTLKNVFFETDKAELLTSSDAELDRLSVSLSSNPKLNLEVRGYTDNTGSEQHNLQLAQARADAVRQYLIAKGISADRIDALSLGSADPVATNDTEDGRALNRRVEFVIK